MGGWEIFSLFTSWQKGAKPPISWRPPSPTLPIHLFQVLSNTPPHHSTPPTHTVLSAVLFLWLNGWFRHIWCAIYLMILWIYTTFTFMQQGIKFTEVWQTHNLVFYWYSDLISHTTNTHSTFWSQDTSIRTYIYTTCHVLTAATSMNLNH